MTYVPKEETAACTLIESDRAKNARKSQCGSVPDSSQTGHLGRPWDLSRRKQIVSDQMPRVWERSRNGPTGREMDLREPQLRNFHQLGVGGWKPKESMKLPTTEPMLSNAKPWKHKNALLPAKNRCPDPFISSLLHHQNGTQPWRKETDPISSLLAGFRVCGQPYFQFKLNVWTTA